MDLIETDIITYEEIHFPGDVNELGPDVDKSSSSYGEQVKVAEENPISPEVDSERAEMINTILDSTVAPRRIERNGKPYILRLSRQPPNRDELMELSKNFEEKLKKRQVKMQGYCPIRRELYDQLFDELIRQSTLVCPERGQLLLRVRDEFKMIPEAEMETGSPGLQVKELKSRQVQDELVAKLKKQHNAEKEKFIEEIKKLKAKLYLKVATACLLRDHGDTKEPPRKKIKLESKKVIYLILDTNIYLHNLNLVKQLLQEEVKVNQLYAKPCLSAIIIKELDKLKGIKETEICAKMAVDYISKKILSDDKVVKQDYQEVVFLDTIVKVSNDEKILIWGLKIAKRLQEGDCLVIVTNDKNFSNLTRLAGLSVMTAKELKKNMCIHSEEAQIPPAASSQVNIV